jgi:hypothetical protein
MLNFQVTEDGRLLEEYRSASEALLDAITVLQGRLHTRDGTECKRLAQLIEKSGGPHFLDTKRAFS